MYPYVNTMANKQIRIALLAVSCAFVSSAHAADWPAKPIRMVHGFTAGGNVDITARIVAQILSEGLGQTVIVDGRPGAGGTLAANIVAKSEPDGYTLFTMASGHSISPGLYRSLPYDAVRDFTMVSLVSSFPFVIAVGANSPVKSIAELIRLTKDKPGATTLAHAGVGTGMHMSGVLLQARTTARFNEVPYKGGTAAPLAAVQGEVVAVFDTPAGMEALIQSGRLRPLAITFAQRWGNWPDVPTLAETVAPGLEVKGWLALAGPRGLPQPVVTRIAQVLHKGLARPDVIERLRQLGTGAAPTQPGETQQFLAAEVARWLRIVRDEKIPYQD